MRTRREWTWSLAAVALFAGVNVFFQHSGPGRSLQPLYPLLYYLPIGILLPALLLARAFEPADEGRLPVAGLGIRDLPVALFALAATLAVAWFPLRPLLAEPGGVARAHRLFSLLAVASLSEVLVFLGLLGNAVFAACRRAGLGRPASMALATLLSSVAFGLYHFSYPAPWNTWPNALGLAAFWVVVSAVFFVARSTLAAFLVDNVMATVGFVNFGTDIEYLWQNVIGAAVVVLVGVALSPLGKARSEA